DGGQGALGQANVVEVACLIQLERNVGGLYHLDGNSVEQFALGIPVEWVLGENFLVALDVGGHGVWTIVPHVLIVHRLNSIYAAQLIDHALRHWIQGLICSQCIEVWFFSDAGVDDGVVIRNFHSDHLKELRAFSCSQSKCFFLAQCLGVLVVFLSAFDHFKLHRGIGGVVLIEVQYPFQTG